MSNARKIKDNLESEWEVYNPSMDNKHFDNNSENIKNNMQSDWEVYHEPVKENYLSSLLMAPKRIASDIGEGLQSAYKAAPDYFEKAQTEIPGLIPTAKEHPLHLLGQGVAGLGEFGQKLFNAPHKLIEYGSERLHLLPEKWGEVARMSEMPDSKEQINALFGEPTYPGEAMTRGIARNIDIALPATKIPSLLAPTSNKAIAKAILKKHDSLQQSATQGFKDVAQIAKERNIPNVPIHQSLDISKIERFFPKSEEAKELLHAARSGDYDALRKVQSDLFREGNKSLKSTESTERKKGAKMLESREKINKAISDNLILTGNEDLSFMLNQSRKEYKTLQDIYYNKKIPSSIKNMVGEDRAIPKNLHGILKKDSKSMKKFMEFHPGLSGKTTKYGMQKALSNALRKYALPAAGAASGIAGYEWFKGK